MKRFGLVLLAMLAWASVGWGADGALRAATRYTARECGGGEG